MINKHQYKKYKLIWEFIIKFKNPNNRVNMQGHKKQMPQLKAIISV